MTLNIVILAGGKGTRIKNVLKNTPKILAPVANKTLLDWILIWIDSWELEVSKNILLSTCVGHNQIKKYCDEKKLNVKCMPEENNLGTFGALANVACRSISTEYLILNGDTIFKANVKEIYNGFKNDSDKKPLIILKKTLKNKRYGGYKKIKEGWIFTDEKTNFISLGAFFISYEEIKKRWINSTEISFDIGNINNLKKEIMIDNNLFGKDPISAVLLEEETSFIDIGIPQSYEKAQSFIPKIIEPQN